MVLLLQASIHCSGLKKGESQNVTGENNKSTCLLSLSLLKKPSGKPNLAASTYISLASSGHLAPCGPRAV